MVGYHQANAIFGSDERGTLMAVTTRSGGQELRGISRPQDGELVEPKRVQPVKLWAAGGALTLAFMVYVLGNWISGPYFKRVPAGPTHLPTWMKLELTAFEVVLIPIALGCLYWFVVRPWRRERRVGIDGVFAIAFLTLSFQDPISVWAQPWFTYNSYLVNFGSWVAGVPGMTAFHAPGRMINEPLLVITPVYVIALLIANAFGCAVLRRVRARWPRISNPSLVGVAFLAMVFFDFLFEGIIFLPLGIWEYGGGHWPLLFRHTYHVYPLQENLTFASTFTVTVCVRYFRDDKGYSIAERGIEEIKASDGRKFALRALAMIALCNLAMLCFYTIPNTIMSINAHAWPKDLQQRSYLTDYVCGAGTDRVCPGPTTPIVRNGGPWMGPNGRLIVPAGARLQPIFPFKAGG
jgi:Spirocyclase AveC-like